MERRRGLKKTEIPFCSSANGKCNLKQAEMTALLAAHPHDMSIEERVKLSNRVRSSAPDHGPLCRCGECPVVKAIDQLGQMSVPAGKQYNPIGGCTKMPPLSKCRQLTSSGPCLNRRDTVVSLHAGRTG